MTNQRKTRPQLVREQPIRSFNTAFGIPPAAAASTEGKSAPNGDAVSRAVDLGYRVVDEYIKQGQRAARRMTDRSAAGPQAFAGDLQQVGTRVAEFAEQWIGLWVELAQGMAGTAGPQGRGEDAPLPGGVPPHARPPQSTGEASAVARVRIDVSASGPHEVSLDLRPAAARSELILHALREADPELPRIDDLSFVPSEDGSPGILKVRIPAEHPPGTYAGVIIDKATHRPVGTLSVHIPAR